MVWGVMGTGPARRGICGWGRCGECANIWVGGRLLAPERCVGRLRSYFFEVEVFVVCTQKTRDATRRCEYRD